MRASAKLQYQLAIFTINEDTHDEKIMTHTSPALLTLSLPPGTYAALDLLSFTTAPNFTGFKDIPPGAHLFFASPSASLASRNGTWLYVPPPSSSAEQPLVIYKWDTSTETLLPVTTGPDALSARANLGAVWPRLVPYTQLNSAWPDLSKHITPAYLERVFAGPDWAVDTFSEAADPSADAGTYDRLHLLPLSSHRWPAAATGRARTLAATDGSWYLADALARIGGEDSFLAEAQFCFLTALTLSNMATLEHWRALWGVVLRCREAVDSQPGFFAKALGVLEEQLGRLADDDDEAGQDAAKALANVAMEDKSEAELLAHDLPVRKLPRSALQVAGQDDEVPVPTGVSELARMFLDSDAGVTAPDGTPSSFLAGLLRGFRRGLSPGTKVEVRRALGQLEGRLFEWFGWAIDDNDEEDEDDDGGEEYAPAVVDLTQEQLDALGYGGTVVANERREDVQADLAALRDGGMARVVGGGDSDDDGEAECENEDEEEEWDTTLEDLDERY